MTPDEQEANMAFHEIWFIYAPQRHPWGGVRIAHFRKTVNGATIVYITGETDHDRSGPRIWEDVAPREGWVKVKQIMPPTEAEVDMAVNAKLLEIAKQITKEGGFDEGPG